MHWQNPVPAVGAVILRDTAGVPEALLALRAREPQKGKWDLPGGILEVAEGPEEGLRRELAEETGMEARSLDLLGVWTGRYGDRHTLNLLYRVEASGEPVAQDDVAELRWWPLDRLPELAWSHEGEALRRVGRAGSRRSGRPA